MTKTATAPAQDSTPKATATAEGSEAKAAPAFTKGQPAPMLKARDIRGQEVDLAKIIAERKTSTKPYLIIELFFSVATGKDVAAKLKLLNARYPDELRIIAIGLDEEEAALKSFADSFGIEYFLVSPTTIEDPAWVEQVKDSPLTIFIAPEKERTILKAFRGGDVHKARLINGVAVNFMNQGRSKEAEVIADLAKAQNEDGSAEIKGYILAAAGKLDDAEKEFGAIGSKTGMARVALERGNYETAIQLASQADPKDGYAQTIQAQALMRSGKLDEAAKVFESAAYSTAEDWQYSETANGMGRLKQEQGDFDAALTHYGKAVDLQHYNVVALSNEGAIHREKGDLAKASEVLEKAQSRRGDDSLSAMMLEQVRNELRNANDVKRGELIRKQIKDLVGRWEELKAAGKDKPVDEWTTRPLIIAFLPGRNVTSVFFPRAGTDVVLRRELETRLHDDERITVVEREMLDALLQELQLGSSELADPNTQTQLGKVLSANMLSFVEFGQAGADTIMYLRVVNTETTGIITQLSRNLKGTTDLRALVDGVAGELLSKIIDDTRLQGLIADAASEDAIMINLGQSSGIQEGQRFMVIEEGDPIEVGGKIIAHRQNKVAELQVTEVQDTYALCKVVQKKDDVVLAKNMKIKEPAKK